MFENVAYVNGQPTQVSPYSDDEGQERRLVHEAIDETDDEINDSALDLVPDDNDGDTELEQVEGPDGNPLSLDEIAETNINGHDDNNLGRPLQIAADEALVEQRQRDKAEIAQLRQRLDQLENGPQRQQQVLEHAKEQLYQRYGVLGTDQRTDQLIRDIAQSQAAMQQLQNHKINVSFAAAREQDPEGFDRAFGSLTSQDANDPEVQARVQAIVNSPNPGQTMISKHFGDGGYGLSRRGTDPSSMWEDGARSRAYSGPSRGRGSGDFGPADVARQIGNRDIEREIADSVWD